MMYYRIKRNPKKVLLFLSFLIVFINEFFIYSLYRLSWNSLRCETANCTTILFVADPQILGETFDTSFYNKIAIFDSDRFLRNTFTTAIAHSEPDMICFMGDLMDEGSIAINSEYKTYVDRFKSVFQTPSNIKQMHIPGDNDIGGERTDYITPKKINRFKEAFNERNTLIVNNKLRLININLLTHNYPEMDDKSVNDFINIIVTHISILSYPGLSLQTILSKFKPSIIFSAHMHISRFITYPPIEMENFNDYRIIKVNYSGHMEKRFTEIMVPTCSYRMGVLNTGYGLAVLENDKLTYTVLWSPNRFTYLWIYVGWCAFASVIIIFWILFTKIPFCTRRVTYRYRQRLMIATDKF